MQPDNAAADGLRTALGGAIVHDEEIGIRTALTAGDRLSMTLPYHPALTSGDGAGLAVGPVVTLLDTICGVTTLHHLDYRESTATLDLRIDYLHPASPGLDLIASARISHLTGTIARGNILVEAVARHPGQTEPIARAIGRFFRKKLPPAARAHDLSSDHDITNFHSYHTLMQFRQLGQGVLLLPYRTGLIGNGALPSLHGGALAAHLQEAACGIMVGTRTPVLAAAHFTYQTYGKPRDVIATARVEKQGAAVSFVSARSRQAKAAQPGSGAAGPTQWEDAHDIAAGSFTFVAS